MSEGLTALAVILAVMLAGWWGYERGRRAERADTEKALKFIRAYGTPAMSCCVNHASDYPCTVCNPVSQTKSP